MSDSRRNYAKHYKHKTQALTKLVHSSTTFHIHTCVRACIQVSMQSQMLSDLETDINKVQEHVETVNTILATTLKEVPQL